MSKSIPFAGEDTDRQGTRLLATYERPRDEGVLGELSKHIACSSLEGNLQSVDLQVLISLVEYQKRVKKVICSGTPEEKGKLQTLVLNLLLAVQKLHDRHQYLGIVPPEAIFVVEGSGKLVIPDMEIEPVEEWQSKEVNSGFLKLWNFLSKEATKNSVWQSYSTPSANRARADIKYCCRLIDWLVSGKSAKDGVPGLGTAGRFHSGDIFEVLNRNFERPVSASSLAKQIKLNPVYEVSPKNPALKLVQKSFGLLIALGLAALLGWLAYSAWPIADRKVNPPAALTYPFKICPDCSSESSIAGFLQEQQKLVDGFKVAYSGIASMEHGKTGFMELKKEVIEWRKAREAESSDQVVNAELVNLQTNSIREQLLCLSDAGSGGKALQQNELDCLKNERIRVAEVIRLQALVIIAFGEDVSSDPGQVSECYRKFVKVALTAGESAGVAECLNDLPNDWLNEFNGKIEKYYSTEVSTLSFNRKDKVR